MPVTISTAEGDAVAINTSLARANSVLNVGESSHNGRGTSLSGTCGFDFEENVSVLKQRASAPMSKAISLLDTERRRIYSIYLDITKREAEIAALIHPDVPSGMYGPVM